MRRVFPDMRAVWLALIVLAACGRDGDTGVVVGPPPSTAATQWEAIIPNNSLPAEAFGRIAVPNRADFTLTGLDPATGRALWLRVLPQGTIGFSAFGELFVAQKLDAADSTATTFIDPVAGLDLWSIRLSTLQPKMVLRVGGTFVAQINDTLLVGLDRTSGRESWRVRLRPLTCIAGARCGSLTPIGVDRGDGYILRQSSVESQILTVRETGVVSQIVSASPVLRRVTMPEQLSAVEGAALIVAVAQGDAIGVDPATGAERWRTAFSTLIPPTYAAEPSSPRFTTDGALLVAQFTDSVTARELVLGTTTGQQVRQRPITVTQLKQVNFRCGANGYAYLRDSGFEYVDLRTGLVSSVDRPGLLATLTTAGLRNALATTNGYVVFSQEFSRAGRHLGAKCAP